MAMRLFIKEGGDAKLPNESRGFNLELRVDGAKTVLLYTAQVNKTPKGYVISTREPDKFPIPVSLDNRAGPALREAFRLVREKAVDYRYRGGYLPVMYQDTSPGEGKIIRNLETFMPVLIFE